MITNLGQVPLCLFSNLITIPVQWCWFWVSVVGTALFYWFQGRNLLWDDQNFKRGGDDKKEENQISREGVLFLLIKNYVTFCCCCSCFSRYYTQSEVPRIKLMTALLF